MATPHFPTFLLLLSLSCVALLLLAWVTPPAPPLPAPWRSPSCGVGRSWAIRLRPGPYYEEDGGEEVAVQLDVVANRVQRTRTA